MESIYVLINTSPGAVENITKKIADFKNVKDVAVVTGAYDIIAKIEGEYITELLTTVVRGIRQIEGVISTETLVVVKL
jgi:DNA-binding Lrp family transcriptional regulator